MNGSIAIVIAAGILMFVFSYLMFKLVEKDNKHFLLQILLFFLIFSLAVILGRAAVDSSNYCVYDVLNSTVESNVTTYEYGLTCTDNPSSNPTIFYNLTLWFFRLGMLYLFLYFTYEVLVYLGWVVPKPKESDADLKKLAEHKYDGDRGK